MDRPVMAHDALERPRWLLWAIAAVTLLSACKMDEVVRGEGRVISSGGRVISAVDAGMIEEILVKEGQEVEEGQVLLRIASTWIGPAASSDKVVPAEVRSPMNGTVKRLHVNTVGGFVPQGMELVEIVPLEDNLLIEAKIKPRDIGFLQMGQPALVKITAYDFSIFGGLEGELIEISPDSITDERDNTFYLIKVRTNGGKLVGKKSAGYEDMEITPGMVAEVVILRQGKIGRVW